MWKSLLLCAAVCIGACGGSTEPKDAAAGTYSLASVDGHALPALTSSYAYTTAGSIVLHADGYFVEENDFQSTSPGVTIEPWVAGGRWTVDGSILTLSDTSASPRSFTATIASRTIVTSDGYLYQKQ